jgi:hypothetical protein
LWSAELASNRWLIVRLEPTGGSEADATVCSVERRRSSEG